MHRRPTTALAAMAVVITVTACGSSSTAKPNAPEVVAPGDIPDTQAFVPYAATGFSFSVPEGWSRTVDGSTTIFTDHYNSIAVVSAAAAAARNAATVQVTEVPTLRRDVPNFELI